MAVLTNSVSDTVIVGSTDLDSIFNDASNVTIYGADNFADVVENRGDSAIISVQGGDDVIVGFTESDTLKISDATYNTSVEGGDLRINLVNSRKRIIPKDAARGCL